jgi:hypothetical protein
VIPENGLLELDSAGDSYTPDNCAAVSSFNSTGAALPAIAARFGRDVPTAVKENAD